MATKTKTKLPFTTSLFWDCECQTDSFRRPKATEWCPDCEAEAHDCPDSRSAEVVAAGLATPAEILAEAAREKPDPNVFCGFCGNSLTCGEVQDYCKATGLTYEAATDNPGGWVCRRCAE